MEIELWSFIALNCAAENNKTSENIYETHSDICMRCVWGISQHALPGSHSFIIKGLFPFLSGGGHDGNDGNEHRGQPQAELFRWLEQTHGNKHGLTSKKRLFPFFTFLIKVLFDSFVHLVVSLMHRVDHNKVKFIASTLASTKLTQMTLFVRYYK